MFPPPPVIARLRRSRGNLMAVPQRRLGGFHRRSRHPHYRFLLADDHDLNGSGTAAGLIPIDEVDAAEFAQIHFSIGAETPAEIAVSIAAQMISVRANLLKAE